MTTLSSLGGGVRKIARGNITPSDSLSSGTGINTKYFDVDISSEGISDLTKCAVIWHGSASAGSIGSIDYECYVTLVSTSVLRVGCLYTTATDIAGQWQIIEYN